MGIEANAKVIASTTFTQAIKQYEQFIGPTGRIATLPDIANARTDLLEGSSELWSNFYNTSTSEYFGYSKKRNPIIIVAHGVGPMSSPEGIRRAYKSTLKPERHRGAEEGRVSQKDFSNLESGKFGEVSVIDYSVRFFASQPSWEAYENPLVRARLGKRFAEILLNAQAISMADQSKLKGERRFDILDNSDSDHYPYHHLFPDQPPLAHLLTLTQLSRVYSEGSTFLAFDIHCKPGLSPVKFIAIKDAGPISGVINIR